MTSRLVVGVIASLLPALSLVPTARASVITYQASGTGSDGSLAASVQFTTTAGTLDIVLSNILASSVIRSGGQALSDISFTLSNAPGTLGATSATGQLGNVSGTGTVTYTSGSPVRFLGQGPPSPNGTGTLSISSNTIALEALGGGKPSEMIAPYIANGGTYTNVNQGFRNFDLYTIGPATFILDLSGITADTIVTAATFSFGTGPDAFLPGTSSTSSFGTGQDVPGSPATVPEPTSLAILAAALLGFGLVGVSRRRRP